MSFSLGNVALIDKIDAQIKFFDSILGGSRWPQSDIHTVRETPDQQQTRSVSVREQDTG